MYTLIFILKLPVNAEKDKILFNSNPFSYRNGVHQLNIDFKNINIKSKDRYPLSQNCAFPLTSRQFLKNE